MNYHKYVIEDGKLVGKFEEMYQNIEDPWNLVEKHEKEINIDYYKILNYVLKIKNLTNNSNLKTLEIGCGYPQLTNILLNYGFDAYGFDASKTVISKSKKIYKKLKKRIFVDNFNNFNTLKEHNADILIMSDITWYILEDLDDFLEYIKKNLKNKYLIHSLAVYGKNKQKYGKDYFYDLNSMLKYYNLEFLDFCSINNNNDDGHTFFLAKIL